MLAVDLAVERFRMCIDGHPFKMVTDRASLKWMHGFNYCTKHRKSSQNVVADELS